MQNTRVDLDRRPSATIIIPALNELENLQVLIPKIIDLYSLIVVDNGSTDGTIDYVRSTAATLLICKKRGYGMAIQTAFHHILQAKNPTNLSVVIFDADGTSPYDAIPKMLRLINHDAADIVIGQRLKRQKGSMPLHSYLGNQFALRMISILTGKKYQDLGPLRALKISAIEELGLVDKTWGWNVEMQIKAAMRNLKVREVSIEYKKRTFGKSKISGSVIGSLRAGSKLLTSILNYYLLEKLRIMRENKPQG